jgi:hypothetical protein
LVLKKSVLRVWLNAEINQLCNAKSRARKRKSIFKKRQAQQLTQWLEIATKSRSLQKIGLGFFSSVAT